MKETLNERVYVPKSESLSVGRELSVMGFSLYPV